MNRDTNAKPMFCHIQNALSFKWTDMCSLLSFLISSVLSFLQLLCRRLKALTASAGVPVTWRDTTKSSPWSRSPAKPLHATWRRSSTDPRSTSRECPPRHQRRSTLSPSKPLWIRHLKHFNFPDPSSQLSKLFNCWPRNTLCWRYTLKLHTSLLPPICRITS